MSGASQLGLFPIFQVNLDFSGVGVGGGGGVNIIFDGLISIFTWLFAFLNCALTEILSNNIILFSPVVRSALVWFSVLMILI